MAHIADPAGGSSSSSSVGVFTPYHFTAFVAMETPVTIIPRFSMDAIAVFGSSSSSPSRRRRWCGPFVELYPIEVPLYLALHLRLTGTCTISLPSYLRLEHLQGVVEREQADDSNFEPLPFYFFETAKKLLEAVAGGGGEGAGGQVDGESVTEVMRLVREIHVIRQQKLQRSMAIFEGLGNAMSIPGIKLTNIAANELEFLRCSFAVVLYQAHRMEQLRTARVDRVLRVAPGGTTAPGATQGSSLAPSETPQRMMRGSMNLNDSADFSPFTEDQSRQQQRTSAGGSSRWAGADGLFQESESLSMIAGTTGGPAPTSVLASSQPSTVFTSTTGGGLDGELGQTPLLAPPPAKKRRILRQT